MDGMARTPRDDKRKEELQRQEKDQKSLLVMRLNLPVLKEKDQES
jgi:hypothetical protein